MWCAWSRRGHVMPHAFGPAWRGYDLSASVTAQPRPRPCPSSSYSDSSWRWRWGSLPPPSRGSVYSPPALIPPPAGAGTHCHCEAAYLPSPHPRPHRRQQAPRSTSRACPSILPPPRRYSQPDSAPRMGRGRAQVEWRGPRSVFGCGVDFPQARARGRSGRRAAALRGRRTGYRRRCLYFCPCHGQSHLHRLGRPGRRGAKTRRCPACLGCVCGRMKMCCAAVWCRTRRKRRPGAQRGAGRRGWRGWRCLGLGWRSASGGLRAGVVGVRGYGRSVVEAKGCVRMSLVCATMAGWMRTMRLRLR